MYFSHFKILSSDVEELTKAKDNLEISYSRYMEFNHGASFSLVITPYKETINEWELDIKFMDMEEQVN